MADQHSNTFSASQIIKCEDLNTKAVQEMKQAKTLDDVEKTMKDTCDEAKKIIGREITYSDIRMLFG